MQDFSTSDVRTLLEKFPKQRFANLPTPLEPLDRLSATLGGPRLWIKRDDCTGLATGGNKTRKLEFLMGDALDRNADIIITQGATQSNHVRQTAAIAAKLGFECYIFLEDRTGFPDPNYRLNGNVLLDRLFGAHLAVRPSGTDMAGEMEALAAELRTKGSNPYIIPGGGSNAIGALGYVEAAAELMDQAEEIDLEIDLLVHATGSAGTQAGLVAGMAALKDGVPLLGIGVRAPRPKQEASVLTLARSTAAYLGLDTEIEQSFVRANCDYVGEGYGIPTAGMKEAVQLLAEQEGVLLDPVYSGKGMAGLIDLIRKQEMGDARNIVFLHTGGVASLFGYSDIFDFPAIQDPAPPARQAS